MKGENGRKPALHLWWALCIAVLTAFVGTCIAFRFKEEGRSRLGRIVDPEPGVSPTSSVQPAGLPSDAQAESSKRGAAAEPAEDGWGSTNDALDSAQAEIIQGIADGEQPSLSHSHPKQQPPRPDCWTQNRTAMAGAMPCLTEGIPTPGNAKVALTFLVNDQVASEPIWAAFIASAAELTLRTTVPPTQPSPPSLLPKLQAVDSNTTCEYSWDGGAMFQRWNYTGEMPEPIENATAWMQHKCGTTVSGRELYALQDLYSIYVHRKKDAAPFPPDSIFSGREIHHLVETELGEPSLVAAHRALLAAALQDPRNSMFLLISESCIPLYHPALLWAQLMAEVHVSRVSQSHYHAGRWNGAMRTEHLKPENFRKSSQWSSLTRMHALLAVQDEHVWVQFEWFCRTLTFCAEGQEEAGMCVADEHFTATILNAYDMSESVDHLGRLTFTHWKRSGWHPETFYPGNVTEYVRRMRTADDTAECSATPTEAMRTAATLFSREPYCPVAQPTANGTLPAPAPDPPLRRRRLRGGASAAGSRRLLDATNATAADDPVAAEGSVGSAQEEDAPRPGVLAEQITVEAPEESSVAEVGDERDAQDARWAETIYEAMKANLAAQGWLGDFEPMRMHCPLLARKVSPEAVPQFAEAAWRCSGLGLAWECMGVNA